MTTEDTENTERDAETMSDGVEMITSQSDSVALYQKLCDAVCEIQDLKRERDEAREALSDWENAALHVEADHADEKHCGCVPVLRKLLNDARSERDEAREELKAFQPLEYHDCSFYKDIMGNCIICKNKETK
jgi:hypothetical protein